MNTPPADFAPDWEAASRARPTMGPAFGSNDPGQRKMGQE
jgi:hypothetical protein